MPVVLEKKKKTIRKPLSKTRIAKSSANGIAASYNAFKEYKGKHYTGMTIGRSHKWYYDKGEWKERKVTPDLWEIYYAVTKRRAGKAPEGSGVPVGSGYHWYIMAHQNVIKLNADDYTTEMSGIKFKLAHKPAATNKWSSSANAQRKQLVKLLKEMIGQLEREPVPLKIEHKGEILKGEGIPVPGTCQDGVCFELEITLNGEYIGILHKLKSGWKMDGAKDQKLVDAIGEAVLLWYE